MAESLRALVDIGLDVPVVTTQLYRRVARATHVSPSAASPVTSSPLVVNHTEQNTTTEVVPRVLGIGEPPPRLENKQAFTCLSYNVLLPNSKDGWWIYKYYRDPSEEHTCWSARQALLKQQLSEYRPDVICLQETSELSFDEDFKFLADSGYQALMHNKKGRMRPATFWRKGMWESVVDQHKDRALVVGLRQLEGAGAGNVVFVVNAHLAAGPSADRRLRQAHEALETIAKEVKKMGIQPKAVPVVFCGDFNSQGKTAVRELLVAGEVGPSFRECGDQTERGQQGNQVTSKVKSHVLSQFADAAEVAFAERGAPATILATNIDSKMLFEDGSTTPAVVAAINAAFDTCCSEGRNIMVKEDVDRYLVRVNRELGRGSEYRFTQAVFERKGEETLSREDFLALYAEELTEGKFWGVEHDLRALGGSGMAVPTDGPCELRFDYMYFTPSSLRLLAVYDPLTEAHRRRIRGEPWEVLPNAFHPSDHLPVTSVFCFQ